MTVHHLAVELYRWIKQVEELEKAQAQVGPETPLSERRHLETQLLEARKAVDHYRQLLEAQKEKPLI